MTPSQIIHRIRGAPTVEGCSEHPSFHCYVCGGASIRGQDRDRWMGQNFTGQNRARCPSSSLVCEACVAAMAGRPPDTERMWSHLVEGDEHVRVNKGGKPAIRDFLRRTHRGPWFAAIADTGQKHIIPWCPVNAPRQGGGRVLFEETLVELPRTEAGWRLLDQIAEALTDGLTKEEIGSGEYGSRAWQLLGERLRTLESTWSVLRGGSWFELAVWLAQRDEDKVAVRMAAEKEEKKRGRTGKGKASNADGRDRLGASSGVPKDAGVQRPEALGPTDGSAPRRRTKQRDAGGVAHVDDADAADRSATGGQRPLFS